MKVNEYQNYIEKLLIYLINKPESIMNSKINASVPIIETMQMGDQFREYVRAGESIMNLSLEFYYDNTFEDRIISKEIKQLAKNITRKLKMNL